MKLIYKDANAFEVGFISKKWPCVCVTLCLRGWKTLAGISNAC